MSNVTSYFNNGVYYYLNTLAQSASGASGASGVSGASNCSMSSGVTVNSLTLNEVLEQFKTGNLTKGEMDKWLAGNKNVKNSSFVEQNGYLSYTFTYDNREYKVSCNKEAAASQTDNKKQNTFSAGYLKTFGLPENVISEFFTPILQNKNYTEYALKPDCGYENIRELKKAYKEGKLDAKETVISTREQRFDDGSYSIYEIDEKGRDLKRIDYNADGSLERTLEFTYNDDGTVMHTVKNSKGTTIQVTNLDKDGNVTHNSWFNDDGRLSETADYTRDENGVETTITKDANGTIRHKNVYDWKNNKRIAKETYDIEGKLMQYDKYEYKEDGSMTETTLDANDKIITIVNYNADGNLNKIEYFGGTDNIVEKTNFYYDTEGQRLEITEDANGGTLVFRQFDKKGNIIFEFNPNNHDLNDLKEMKNIIENQLYNNTTQMRSIVVPEPPNAMDYRKTSDGSVDEEAYAKAMEEYNKQMIIFENNVNKLNQNTRDLHQNFIHIEKQLKAAELEAKISNINDITGKLKNPKSVSIIQTQSRGIERDLTYVFDKKTELQDKLENIYSQMLNQKVPTPPSTADCVKEDGTTDEEKYMEAFNQYEKEKDEYDRKIKVFNNQSAKIHSMIARLEHKEKYLTAKLDSLEQQAIFLEKMENTSFRRFD